DLPVHAVAFPEDRDVLRPLLNLDRERRAPDRTRHAGPDAVAARVVVDRERRAVRVRGRLRAGRERRRIRRGRARSRRKIEARKVDLGERCTAHAEGASGRGCEQRAPQRAENKGRACRCMRHRGHRNQGKAKTQTAEPRSGGLRCSGKSGTKLEAWKPPWPVTTATYCLPSTV